MGARSPLHRGDGRWHPPSTALAKSAGLEVERGIMVDDHMVTSDPAIMSVGECVQHRGICYGLVAPLVGNVPFAGRCGNAYTGSVTSTKLKVSGIDLFSAGDFSGGEGCEDIVMRDAAAASTSAYRQGQQAGRRRALWRHRRWQLVFRPAEAEEDVADIREALIFGQAFAQGGGALADLMRPLLPFRMMPKSAAATALQRQGG
jgi:nitrite reductase (NADH) large subunit